MKSKTVFTSAAALTVLLAVASPVTGYAGENHKVYSGGECHVGHYNDFPNAVWHIYSGSFINYGKTFIRVSCPIVKDEPSKKIAGGWIYMIDENPSYNVRCALVSLPSNGNSGGYTTTRYIREIPVTHNTCRSVALKRTLCIMVTTIWNTNYPLHPALIRIKRASKLI